MTHSKIDPNRVYPRRRAVSDPISSSHLIIPFRHSIPSSHHHHSIITSIRQYQCMWRSQSLVGWSVGRWCGEEMRQSFGKSKQIFVVGEMNLRTITRSSLYLLSLSLSSLCAVQPPRQQPASAQAAHAVHTLNLIQIFWSSLRTDRFT